VAIHNYLSRVIPLFWYLLHLYIVPRSSKGTWKRRERERERERKKKGTKENGDLRGADEVLCSDDISGYRKAEDKVRKS
jgi:hypothetical protein